MRLGQDVRGADVEKEAGEEAQVEDERGRGNLESKVEAAPAMGASASSAEHGQRSGAWCSGAASIRLTVLSPSAKSWAITAVATTRPTVVETWKPRPMPTPSMKLWATRAEAERTPICGVVVVGVALLLGVVDEGQLLHRVEEQEAHHQRHHGPRGVQAVLADQARRPRAGGRS